MHAKQSLTALAIAPERLDLLTKPPTVARHTAARAEKAVADGLSYSGVLVPEGLADLRRFLAKFVGDTSDAPLVLHINSPGGFVESTPETAEMVRRVARTREVWVASEGFLASGAFWIASGATRIFASPSTKVGSVGVLLSLVDTSKAAAADPVQLHYLATSPAKVRQNYGTPIDDAEIAAAERLLSEWKTLFEASLKASPRYDRRVIADLFTAEIYTAAVAKQRGWIDDVMLVEDVIDLANSVTAASSSRSYSGLHGRAAAEKLSDLITTAAGPGCRYALDAPEAVRNEIKSRYPELAKEADRYYSGSLYRPSLL